MKKFPAWLTRREDGVFVIDPDIAYPTILKALRIKDDQLDQYWLEVAYQSAKLFTQDLIAGTEYDPRPERHLTMHILGGSARKKQWGLANYKAGRGAYAATKGREAVFHYEKIKPILMKDATR